MNKKGEEFCGSCLIFCEFKSNQQAITDSLALLENEVENNRKGGLPSQEIEFKLGKARKDANDAIRTERKGAEKRGCPYV